MILMVNIHYSRALDIVTSRSADHRSGNASHGLSRRLRQLVQPNCGAHRQNSAERHRGGQRLGQARRVGALRAAARSARPAGRYAGLSVGQPVLRDRSAVGRCLVAIRPVDAGMAARPGHLRFCPQPYRLQLSECARLRGPLGRRSTSAPASAGTMRTWPSHSAAA